MDMMTRGADGTMPPALGRQPQRRGEGGGDVFAALLADACTVAPATTEQEIAAEPLGGGNTGTSDRTEDFPPGASAMRQDEDLPADDPRGNEVAQLLALLAPPQPRIPVVPTKAAQVDLTGAPATSVAAGAAPAPEIAEAVTEAKASDVSDDPDGIDATETPDAVAEKGKALFMPPHRSSGAEVTLPAPARTVEVENAKPTPQILPSPARGDPASERHVAPERADTRVSETIAGAPSRAEVALPVQARNDAPARPTSEASSSFVAQWTTLNERATASGVRVIAPPQVLAGTPGETAIHVLKVQLHPAGLGKVEARLRTDATGLKIEIVAEDERAFRQLSGDKAALPALLSTAATPVSDVTIRWQGDAPDAARQSSFDRQADDRPAGEGRNRNNDDRRPADDPANRSPGRRPRRDASGFYV